MALQIYRQWTWTCFKQFIEECFLELQGRKQYPSDESLQLKIWKQKGRKNVYISCVIPGTGPLSINRDVLKEWTCGLTEWICRFTVCAPTQTEDREAKRHYSQIQTHSFTDLLMYWAAIGPSVKPKIKPPLLSPFKDPIRWVIELPKSCYLMEGSFESMRELSTQIAFLYASLRICLRSTLVLYCLFLMRLAHKRPEKVKSGS